MNEGWKDAEAGSAAIEDLVRLSRLIGEDGSLVQTGGGNTSVKIEEEDVFGRPVPALVVKGSGTDLRTIGAEGFTHLYMERLAQLWRRDTMPDEEMMRLMRACMLRPEGPLPSVETPLHSLLPQRFIAHTHDVATLCLTDTPSASEHIRRLFGQRLAFLQYARPGFPLAKSVAERYGAGVPVNCVGLVLEKHGLVVWGETARECYATLREVIAEAEGFVAERAKGRALFGPPREAPLETAVRRSLAASLMPAIRGELTIGGWPCVLHLDDSDDVLEAIGSARFATVAERGVMTPEHILRAGRQPLVLASAKPEEARDAIRRYRAGYEAVVTRYGQATPIADFLKTIVLPGVGVISAGKDKRNAAIAAECYRATLRAMAGAEAVDRFQFVSEADAVEVEYWPLERRKVEEAARARREMDGKVAIVFGAGGGIGCATAGRLVQAGGHCVMADLEAEAVRRAAAEIAGDEATRTLAVVADVTDAASVAEVFRRCVLEFGGVDVVVYSPGIAPELQGVEEMTDAEAERQMRVHYLGAVAATREAAQVMIRQGVGGRLIYNASKAAYAPGQGAAAYGASKAALVHYVRNVANELGRYGITANYINADAVDTPLFQRVVRQRAQQRGETEEETLRRYAERSALGEATVPPEAVAEAVLWLASARSAHTTGCVITVGGGHEGFPR